MSKKNKPTKKYATEEAFASLEQTVQASEHFLEKNAKILGIIFGVLIVAAVGYFAYLRFVVEPRNEAAQKEITTADQMFANDSINLALNGSPGAYLGYNQIIDQYGGTAVGNIAKYKSAVALYNQGNYQEALDRINSFSTKEKAMSAMKSGIKGDALVQLGQKEKALDAYEEAINASDLDVLQQVYTKKAAILAMDLQAYDRGLKTVQAFIKKHPDSDTNGEIGKLEEMLKFAGK
ncbi:MAG: tetratricopeptide repeat protein [Flavobacteriaceae bacterium]|nr:tetratricopeptide repeat protein [Flavobacteriaceae bacterium]